MEDPSRTSFLTQIDEILAACTASGIQRCLFSATLSQIVLDLAATFLQEPVHITIGTTNAGASTIDQKLVFVGREEGKLLGIRQLIQEGLRPPVLVFVQSKERAKALLKELIYDGINVDSIHSDRTPQQREKVIEGFRRGDVWVLICTDLMARGVDFKGVQMVVNYDLPQTAVAYIHRIGRTGRAGHTGKAVTFFTEADVPRLRSIANVMKLSGCDVPEWMLSIKQV
jgi:ATP-dependent RNA helicase DDX52/ROK1